MSMSLSMEIMQVKPYSSCFPELEDFLETDIGKSFSKRFPKKKLEGYHSKIDFLLCELFPEYKKPCLDYYMNGGRKLVDVHSRKDLDVLKINLLVCCKVYVLNQSTWAVFKRKIKEMRSK